MSLVEWAKKNSRAMGKVGLYATGGLLIGYPVFKFGTELWHGNTVERSADLALNSGFGICDFGGAPIDNTKLRNGAIRTGIGALAIYAAKKI